MPPCSLKLTRVFATQVHDADRVVTFLHAGNTLCFCHRTKREMACSVKSTRFAWEVRMVSRAPPLCAANRAVRVARNTWTGCAM